MRTSQWLLIGFFLIAICTWFIMIDNSLICTPFDNTSFTEVDLWSCINSEILDPFIWILFPLGIIFIICGVIEFIAENKKKK